MATVDKNFRVKHGLVVEGSTGTINGNTILTENGGDQYILNLVGGATLVKSVDSVFSVDGSGNLTLNYGNGLTKSGSNLIVDTSVIASKSYVDTAITNAVSQDTYTAGHGLSLSNNEFSLNLSASDVNSALGYTAANASDLNNLSNQSASDIAAAIQTAETYADSLATNYDSAGAAANAETAAKNYTDNRLGNITDVNVAAMIENTATDTLNSAESYTDTAITNLNLSGTYDALGAACSAESAAKSYADTVSGNAESNAKSYADSLASNYDAAGAAASALTSANTYTDTAVSNVVGLAPAALDTLQELAAAFNNSPDTLTNLITTVGTKQDALTAGEGIYIDGSNVITGRQQSGGGLKFVFNEAAIDRSTVDAWYDASGAAATAQSNAESYADNLASNYDASGSAATAENNAKSYADSLASNYDSAGTASGLVSDLTTGVTAFTDVNVNDVASIKAASASVATAGTANALTWSATDFRTAKALVKFATAGHSQVSEILLTLDVNNNIAITEYAEVGTNGELGTITASYSSGNVSIQVTTLQDNTNVMVYATLLV